MPETEYCILPTKMSLTSRCILDNCELGDVPFSIFAGVRGITRRAAGELAPPDLVELLDAANALGNTGQTNDWIGIADSARSKSSGYCAIRNNVPVKPRGKWDLAAGLVGSGTVRLVSYEAADAGHAPELSAVLHARYGTTKKPPEPPAPPTAEELAATAEAARKRSILRNLGAKLFPALPVEVSEQRACAIVEAVRDYGMA